MTCKFGLIEDRNKSLQTGDKHSGRSTQKLQAGHGTRILRLAGSLRSTERIKCGKRLVTKKRVNQSGEGGLNLMDYRHV